MTAMDERTNERTKGDVRGHLSLSLSLLSVVFCSQAATVTPAPAPVAPAPVTLAPTEASISAAQFQGLVQTMAAQQKLIEDLTAKIDQHF